MQVLRQLVLLCAIVCAAASPVALDLFRVVGRNSMTTAVVGAGGATGLECVKRLLSEGHSVKAVRSLETVLYAAMHADSV